MSTIDDILLGSHPESNFFCRMKFTKDQLGALTKIYNRYFEALMPKDYNGGSVALYWNRDSNFTINDYLGVHSNVKVVCVKDAYYDPLWEKHFSDILPLMSVNGNVSIIPPGEVMNPHVDRSNRPTAIYFPIKGCSENCLTDFYNFPKSNSATRQTPDIFGKELNPLYSVPISENAILFNVHEWHGVRNLSTETRVAFGWNTKTENVKSYNELKQIFKDLGYIDE